MKLENEFLCVEIAELGAELTRIYDKEKNTEVLWNGDPTYWKRHAPVLFPNVGKTWQNKVLIHGVQYPTSQHGFARDNEFTCICSSEERAVFMFAATEETKEVYPFDFELHIAYQLSGKELNVEWQVKNRSEEPIYFTIGGHPAFQFAEKGEKKEDYSLRFPGKNALQYIQVDLEKGCAVPEKVYPLVLDQETCPLSEELLSRDALIFDDSQVTEVWICRKDGTPYVGMRCEEIPSVGIWSVKNAPFVCLEPWAGRCDNCGFDRELSEKPGINEVAVGGTFRKDYTIVVA